MGPFISPITLKEKYVFSQSRQFDSKKNHIGILVRCIVLRLPVSFDVSEIVRMLVFD